jgi:hypothetical protein
MPDGHWTFSEWREETTRKIARAALTLPTEHRGDYVAVQVKAAIDQALRHGRSDRTDDDPVVE